MHCLGQGLPDKLKQQSRNLPLAIRDVEVFAGKILVRVIAGRDFCGPRAPWMLSRSFTELPIGRTSHKMALSLHVLFLTLCGPALCFSASPSHHTLFHFVPSDFPSFQLRDLRIILPAGQSQRVPTQLSAGPLW